MPEVLPPYQIETPAYTPGMAVSVMPMSSKHAHWLDDYEYYDQLGRDPLQVRRIWGISDPLVRVEKVKEVLEEYPKQMHRRKILLKAVTRDDEDIVRCLVETGMKIHPDLQKAKEDEEKEANGEDADNISLPDKDDSSIAPTHIAAVNGYVSIIKLLLDSGVHVDIRDEFGRTPFLAAAMSGQIEAMRFLLDQGADATARAAGNEIAEEYFGPHKLATANALEAIARRRDVDIVKTLLDIPGVEITPLAIWSAAVGSHTYPVLRLLLERGGCILPGQDELLVTEDNEELRQTVLDTIPTCVQENDLASLKLLLGFKYPDLLHDNISPADIPPELHRSFIYGAYTAVANDQPDKFKVIHNLGLKEHDTMSLDDLPEGQTLNIQHLLDEACQFGSTTCARLLIDKYGADPNAYRVNSYTTPLYLAAGNNKPDMVQYLLENNKIDIHVGSGPHADGPTALWVAITHKSLKSVDLLLQHGGPLDSIDAEIRDISGPLDAVLIASSDASVRFETESTAKEYIDGARKDWTIPNSYYVRVKLDASDKEWIEKLELREGGDERNRGREKAERFPERPIFQERFDGLAKDDDLIPKFSPAFRAVKD
jgi:ankyrin repeat protein